MKPKVVVIPVCFLGHDGFDNGWVLGQGKIVEFTLQYPGQNKRIFHARGCLVIIDREDLYSKRPKVFLTQVRRIIRDEFKSDPERFLQLLGLDQGTKVSLTQIGLKMSSLHGVTF